MQFISQRMLQHDRQSAVYVQDGHACLQDISEKVQWRTTTYEIQCQDVAAKIKNKQCLIRQEDPSVL